MRSLKIGLYVVVGAIVFTFIVPIPILGTIIGAIAGLIKYNVEEKARAKEAIEPKDSE